jgi:hypothetical protein
MEAIKFDIVLSKTPDYRCDSVIRRKSQVRHSDIDRLQEKAKKLGFYWVCIGWHNPNPGTWCID